MSQSRSVTDPDFFSGKFVTADDLAQEQQYIREKFKRHNRSLHGFGIVFGLKVTIKAGKITVGPGLALDCEGNEIVVESDQSIVLPSEIDGNTGFVNLRFFEEQTCPPSKPESGQGSSPRATVKEVFEILVAQENSNRRHRHVRARWLACGQPHGLTIAKLRKHPQGWRVDRAYRAPRIK